MNEEALFEKELLEKSTDVTVDSSIMTEEETKDDANENFYADNIKKAAEDILKAIRELITNDDKSKEDRKGIKFGLEGRTIQEIESISKIFGNL